MSASGDDRAFKRGARIVAGFAALVVVVIMIVVVQRDRPVKWETRSTDVDRAAVQASDNGALPAAGNAPTNTSGVVVHPGKSTSDLGSR